MKWEISGKSWELRSHTPTKPKAKKPAESEAKKAEEAKEKSQKIALLSTSHLYLHVFTCFYIIVARGQIFWSDVIFFLSFVLVYFVSIRFAREDCGPRLAIGNQTVFESTVSCKQENLSKKNMKNQESK